MAPGLGRPSPDPRFGSPVELGRGHARGLLDLFGIGEALSGERITAEEPPPALLQIQPARPGGNEDVMKARMIGQPGAGLQTVVTAQIVRNDEDVSAWIVRFDVAFATQCSLWSCGRRHSRSVPSHHVLVTLRTPRFSLVPVRNPVAL